MNSRSRGAGALALAGAHRASQPSQYMDNQSNPPASRWFANSGACGCGGGGGGSNLRVSGLYAGCLNLQCVRRLSERVQVARHSGHSNRPGKCTWQWFRMCVTTLPQSLQRCRFSAPGTRSNVSRMCQPFEPASSATSLPLTPRPRAAISHAGDACPPRDRGTSNGNPSLAVLCRRPGSDRHEVKRCQLY